MYYEAAISLAGKDEATLTKSLIVSLEDTAGNWYSRLAPKCIYSWKQLKEKFMLNFQGFKRLSAQKKIFCLTPNMRRKHCPTSFECFCS
jgi:hypothetical protein